MNALNGRVALVAGATRGCGRGIARALGGAGATVYCTGRSVRGKVAMAGRSETIDETADLINAAGGTAIAIQVDHTDPAQVAALAARIAADHGRLDILINDIWGGDELMEWNKPFWEHDLANGLLMLERGLKTHIITSHALAPLLIASDHGLVIEITDGDSYDYRGSLFYDLVKTSVIRLAYAQAQEFAPHGVTALALTPGFLRSEAMLDYFGVTAENWRDATAKEPDFIVSETPYYIGQAVLALATDPAVHQRSGKAWATWTLMREFGFTDEDGTQPDWGAHFEAVVKPRLAAQAG